MTTATTEERRVASLVEDADAVLARPRSTRTVTVLAGLAVVAVGVSVGLGFWLYALVAVLVGVAVVASVRTELGFLYLLVLAPFGESLTIGPLTIGRLLAALGVLLLLVLLLSRRLRVPRLPTVTWLPAAAFVLLVVASGLWATSLSGWSFAVGQVGLAVVYFVTFALMVKRPEHVTGLLRVYVLGAVVASAIGCLQAITAARATGLQGDANIYALYQVAAMPAAFALASRARGLARFAWGAAMLPIAVSVLLSQSRGAYIALVVTVLVVAALHPRARLLVPLALVSVAVLGGLAVTAFGDRFTASGVSEDRASGRLDIWHVAWRAFQDHIWTGIGAGNFVPQSVERLTTEPGVELLKSHLLLSQGIEVHNIYLESLAERGVFGLLTLVVFLGTTLWTLVRVSRRFPTPVVAALAPMLVAYCVAAFFLSVSNSKLLWMLAGVGAALLATAAQDRLPAVSARRSEEYPLSTPRPNQTRPGSDSARRRTRAEVRRFLLPVIALALATAAAAAVITLQQPTESRSTVTMVVQTSGGANDTETLVRTMSALVDSDVLGEALRQRVASPLSADEITDNLEVERPPGSSVLTVSYSDADPARSLATAQSIIPVFQDQVAKLEAGQAGQLAPNYAIQPWGGGAVISASTAPPVLRNAAIAALVSLLVGGIGAALYRERHPLVDSIEGAEQATGAPVVALPSGVRNNLLHPADVMDALARELPAVMGAPSMPRRVLVVSPHSDRRRSGFITEFARALDRPESPVVLVDADLESGRLSRFLGLGKSTGLADCLRSDLAPSSALVVPEQGPAAGLAVLPVGRELPLRGTSPSHALSHFNSEAHVIIDAPLLSSHQSLGPLVRGVDAVLVLVTLGKTPTTDASLLTNLVGSLADIPTVTVLLSDKAEHLPGRHSVRSFVPTETTRAASLPA